jgi:hypothetical protein
MGTWAKRGTKVRVRGFVDESAHEHNRRIRKRNEKPTPTYLWRVEDLNGESLSQCGFCTERQAAINVAYCQGLNVIDDV